MNTNRNPHLTTINVSTGQIALQVFEQFIVDHSLPKHAGQIVTKEGNVISGFTFTGSVFADNSFLPAWNSFSERSGLFGRLWAALCNRATELYLQKTAVPVEQIFEAIYGKGKKLEILSGRLEAHRDAVKEALAMGQTALAEQLEGRTHMVEMEAILFAAGQREFIEEETLIDFAAKCERGLQLQWIKNFTRLIPHNVRVRKTKMDALKVFDNYLVLSYDPENKSSALTAAEIAKKKDPILFGVIRGSRRLYHIDSWIDEHCDLTFGDLIDRYGADVLTLQ